MAKDNLSVVLYGINDLRVEQVPLPPSPGPDEIQLESATVGICGSDIHFLTHGRIGPFVLTNKIILGHESSATVVAVGAGVKDFKVGDRVAVEPNIPCRSCRLCKIGRYNICPNTKFFATPPSDGSLTRFYNMAPDFCFKLPDHVSYEEGSLVEPIAVAVAAFKRAGMQAGMSVLVTGAGPIGMASVLVANAFGAKRVAIADINHKRVAQACAFGAVPLNLDTTTAPDDVVKQVSDVLGDEPDLCVECTGSAPATSLCIKSVKLAGLVHLVGMGGGPISVPLTDAICKEVTITTSCRYSMCYQTALDLIASGRIDPKPMITHRYDLIDSLKAFEMVKSGEGVKVIINCKK